MLTVATWNVNSIKARLPNVLAWIDETRPDVLLLQEIKTVEESFPALEFRERGYEVAVHGQKSYNGVAIVSRLPLTDIRRGLPGEPGDDQARYVEAVCGERLRVASIYLPNGNPVDGERFDYKLRWMDRLFGHARALKALEGPVVLGGDYNVIPADEDCYAPELWARDALGRPESRQRFRALLHLGWTDAFRALHRDPHAYSFWDYQSGAWNRDLGLRIDHLLLSPQAADLLTASGIDRKPRGLPKASDHTPVWCRLDPDLSA